MEAQDAAGVASAIKASPPFVVTGAMVFGIPVSDAVQLATLIYVLVMIASKSIDTYRDFVLLRRDLNKQKDDEGV